MASSTYSYRGLYLLHFDPPYRHAQHYLGYAKNSITMYARRVISGRAFPPHPLVECAIAAGCEITIAATFPGDSRQDRRRLRRRGGLARICPICRATLGDGDPSTVDSGTTVGAADRERPPLMSSSSPP